MADKAEAIALAAKCDAAGMKVRELKAAKAAKDEVAEAVKMLLALKLEYKGYY